LLSQTVAVFAASLDISKAFGCVNHFKMFSVLCAAGIPVDVKFIIQLTQLALCRVRWNGAYSNALFVVVLSMAVLYLQHCSTLLLMFLSPT